MKKISRREFIRLISKSAGAAAAMQLLNACGMTPAVDSATPTNTPFGPAGQQLTKMGSIAGAVVPTGTPLPSGTPTPTTPPATETSTPAANPAYLAVARGGDDPEALVRAAVEAVGGMGRFVPSGANVIIKPNVCTSNRIYEGAATTNPWVVGALVKMCFEAGAGRVRVFDYPFNGSSPANYQTSGIAGQVLAAGGELESVDWNKFRQTSLPSARSLRSAAFYSAVIDADVVINAPIAKHHGGAGLTLGMKNLMGVVQDRVAIHGDLHPRIADLADFIRPELTVIDAVRILTANGPISQSLNDVRVMNTVIASADIVAADAYATRLFGWTDPNRLGYVRIGHEIGLGRSDLENLEIEEIPVV
ncbi:MAG: DUF362 domain-containing protein [Anaerolineales bacterium]|nr:DUF362 domain-containing protein [Anaerolineales bacterium]